MWRRRRGQRGSLRRHAQDLVVGWLRGACSRVRSYFCHKQHNFHLFAATLSHRIAISKRQVSLSVTKPWARPVVAPLTRKAHMSMSKTIGRIDFHLHSYASNVTDYYAANA